jgi:hypothetical protein
MVISDPVLAVIDESRNQFIRRLGRLCRLRRPRSTSYQYAPSAAPSPMPSTPLGVDEVPCPAATTEAIVPPAANRHEVQAREIVLTADERRARAIALRGLSQSRAHRFDAALASFVEATRLDPALDLAKLPDFWRLPLGAHQAAIDAYECVGRRRDAAALTAAVRSTFRPKLFRPRQAPVPALPDA